MLDLLTFLVLGDKLQGWHALFGGLSGILLASIADAIDVVWVVAAATSAFL